MTGASLPLGAEILALSQSIETIPSLLSAIDFTAFDGFIFDCDGTLADSMPVHYQAWSQSLREKLGRPSDFTEELFYRFGGMPARQIVQRLNHDYGYNLPPEKTAHDKEMLFLKMLPHIGPVPEVVAVLRHLGPQAKVAVASGGLTDIVCQILDHLGIKHGPGKIVKFVVGSDQVSQGKPSPELFLRAARLLQVDPQRCLVFEDAEPGFLAAKAAGMKWLDVRPYRSGLAAAAIY
ncbi:MAG TPA: HAD-IA family hydrolase [Candidatus Methylacidiphilales bacterium]|nr:HAD-IA family hydrolase [Candidatus Methylacidiphilales bacterium]